MRYKKSLPFLIVAVLFSLFIYQNLRLCRSFHGKHTTAGVIFSDALNYYEYLPAIFIRKDVTQQKYGIKIPNGNAVNKVTCGVAILEAPFFFANYTVQAAKGDVGKGYEKSYGYTLLITASVYAFAGLLMLFAFVRKKFGLITALLIIPVVLYGTNMFHYVFAEPGMSHVYSFFCISGLLFFTDRYYEKLVPGRPVITFDFVVLALFGSLAVLIRPTSIIALLIFFLYNCYTWRDIKERVLFFVRNYKIPLWFFIIGVLVFSPQMYYWYITTGKFFIFSYGLSNESFIYWNNPQIVPALFGVFGGWFTYSPIFLFSIITLFWLLYRRQQQALLIFVIFILITYVCSSWWAYNFMCALGYRSFIEYYPVFILPLAWLIHSVLQLKAMWPKVILFIVVAFFVYMGVRINLDFRAYPWCTEELWSWKEYFLRIRIYLFLEDPLPQ